MLVKQESCHSFRNTHRVVSSGTKSKVPVSGPSMSLKSKSLRRYNKRGMSMCNAQAERRKGGGDRKKKKQEQRKKRKRARAFYTVFPTDRNLSAVSESKTSSGSASRPLEPRFLQPFIQSHSRADHCLFFIHTQLDTISKNCCGAHTKVIDDVCPTAQSWHPLLSRDEIPQRILYTY